MPRIVIRHRPARVASERDAKIGAAHEADDTVDELVDISGRAQDRALIALIERVGKGRFAQRLCDHLIAGDVPAYLANAINTIIAAVKRPSAV